MLKGILIQKKIKKNKIFLKKIKDIFNTKKK